MAGEIIGKIYEAILQVVLCRIVSKGIIAGNVFWNEIPEGISVEPDFLIGNDKDHPTHIFFVTHSGSSKNSDMKTWRNLGELCEAKTVLTPIPLAINLAFETTWKADLIRLQEGAFDSQLLVDNRPYGQNLITWVHSEGLNISGTQEEKAEKLKRLAIRNASVNSFLNALEKDVIQGLRSKNLELVSLWQMEKSRNFGRVPKARKTYVRRGWTKRLLLGDTLQGGKLRSKGVHDLITIGLVKKTISGYVICDEELKWFLNTEIASHYDSWAEPFETQGFKTQLAKVRDFKLLNVYMDFLLCHLKDLSDPSKMYTTLKRLHADPTCMINIPAGCSQPNNIWLYDVIAAISKASLGKSQGFGYSSFSAHRLSTSQKIGNTNIGEWCTCFSNQFFNRTASSVPKEAIKYISIVLAEQVSRFNASDIERTRNIVLTQYLEKEYEAVLLAHRGFEPLFALASNAVPFLRKVSFRTCFAEKAGLGGVAGKTTVAQYRNVIINWQSASDAGRDHKRKELCGRAVGLRYTWDDEAKKFKPRPGVKKLVLLLDGTWTQKDLNALVAAGWDEIYYPDEIDKLKASVLGTKVSGMVLSPKRPVRKTYEDEEMREAAEGTRGYGKKK